MTDIYTQEFLYYFKNQPYKKDLVDFTNKGKAVNQHCGDDIALKIKVENGVIKDIGYKSDGCSISQGAMSILSEQVIGKRVEEVIKRTDDEFINMIGIELTPARQNCALNSLNSLRDTLKNEKEK